MKLLELTDLAARTEILGTEICWQTLRWDENGSLWNAACTCPSFSSGKFCKHLVAAASVVNNVPEGISAQEYQASIDAQQLKPEDVVQRNKNKADTGAGAGEENLQSIEESELQHKRTRKADFANQNKQENPALAAGADQTVASVFPSGSSAAKYFNSLTEPELRELFQVIAADYPEIVVRLERLGSLKFASTDTIKDILDSEYKRVFRSRGFIDWYKSYEVSADLDEFIVLMRKYMLEGYASVVEPFAKRTVKRITNMLLRSDDSSGYIGNLCQDSLELYAEVAALAPANSLKLAKWLVKMRIDSPSWPNITLAPFVEALGEEGVAAYRRDLEKVISQKR
ncbi:SWIM zinc finger family protein [Arcanobacterium hippocoleae]